MFLLLFSCKKEDCSSKAEVLDPKDTTVVIGWPVVLNTEYFSATFTNEWSGPNNWKATTTNGIASQQLTAQANFSDAGDYLVESYSHNKCLKYQKTIRVHVIDPPHAPCTMSENTINISSPVAYQITYTQVTSYISNNQFVINASNGNQTITFNFQGTQEPKPGIHLEHNVQMITQLGVYLLDSGQFYVQKINNQLVISFCDAIFYSPDDIQTDVLVSGEVTIP